MCLAVLWDRYRYVIGIVIVTGIVIVVVVCAVRVRC